MTFDAPVRVLYLGHTAGMGGAEIALLNLVQHIDQHRYNPVVVLGAPGPLLDKIQATGIEVHLCAMSPALVQTRKESLGGRSLLRLGAVWHTLGYVWRLRRLLQDHRIQIVHTNTLKADIIGGWAARLAGIPVVWHIRDRIADDYLPPSATRVFRWLCRLVPDFIIANSAATLETLALPEPRSATATHLSTGLERAQVVHDGIAIELDNPPLHGDDSPLASNDPLTDAPPNTVVGLVGRISPWKGQHIFIEAAAAVHREFAHVRFQIIGAPLFGEEAYEAQIRAQVTALQLDEWIEFTGFRTDVPALLQRMDVLVHASTTGEPFGQVVIEGMAAAKPVVATNGGGVPEIVQDQVTGLLVPMGDAAAMAAAILQLLRSPTRAHAMGVAGRQRVQDHFTIEATARRVESIYEQVRRQERHRPALPWFALLVGCALAPLLPVGLLLWLLRCLSKCISTARTP